MTVEKMKTKFCPAMWFSGFFGLAALVHLVRFFVGFSIMIVGREVPLELSGLIALITGILSVGLLILSLKRPCDAGKEGNAVCCK